MQFILPKIIFKVEKWKYNKEYELFVSTQGNFKDKNKKNLPIKIGSSGYCMVDTPFGIKQAHRIVMLTFKPIINTEDLTVDHLNRNKRDNSLNNLEWVTLEENLKRANKLNTLIDKYSGYYIANEKIFSSMEAAIDWVIITQCRNTKSIPHRENIKRNINRAITKKQKYCNMIWKKIN